MSYILPKGPTPTILSPLRIRILTYEFWEDVNIQIIVSDESILFKLQNDHSSYGT